MKIYIVGKISGRERQAIITKFSNAAAKLTAQGHKTFIPRVLPVYEDETTREQGFPIDYRHPEKTA